MRVVNWWICGPKPDHQKNVNTATIIAFTETKIKQQEKVRPRVIWDQSPEPKARISFGEPGFLVNFRNWLGFDFFSFHVRNQDLLSPQFNFWDSSNICWRYVHHLPPQKISCMCKKSKWILFFSQIIWQWGSVKKYLRIRATHNQIETPQIHAGELGNFDVEQKPDTDFAKLESGKKSGK